MNKCETCGTKLTDDTDFNGWCKPCFTVENNKYKSMLARQDGLDGLSALELELLPE
jgi:hypothetical protein